jgi:hypothetical protein
VAPKSKVELFAAIRRDSRTEGLGVRALARKYGVHRRMVREALTSAWPAPRKKLPPRKSRLDPFKLAVDQMLRDDLDAPRKQRHTLKRIFDRLVAEYEMEGVSYSTVGDYVRWRRPAIRVEEGRGPAQVFIPQAHQPGAEVLCGFPHRASYAARANMRRRTRRRPGCRCLRTGQCRIFTGSRGRRGARRGAGSGPGGSQAAPSWQWRSP